MAVMEAQQWCDKAENKAEMADDHRQAPVVQRARSPTSSTASRATIDYGNGRVVENSTALMKFWSDHASYPFQSHDLWFLTEDIRWGKFEPDLDTKALIGKVNREDMWREAAKTLGVAAPTSRPPPRAARRPSSTARCSIPKIRPPISKRSRSSASKSDEPRPLQAAASSRSRRRSR